MHFRVGANVEDVEIKTSTKEHRDDTLMNVDGLTKDRSKHKGRISIEEFRTVTWGSVFQEDYGICSKWNHQGSTFKIKNSVVQASGVTGKKKEVKDS